MRKTLIYFIILLILGFGVYYLVFSPKDPFGHSEAGFSIPDTASIGKIFIADNNGQSVLLERTDSGWRVNKQYGVLAGTLNTLLVTLNKQKAIYPVPENAQDNVIKTMAGTAIKVEVYDRKGEKMTVFYVGGETHNFGGTYMLLDGAHKPYVVNIDGFTGYLTPRYSPHIEDWRDRNIFNVQPDDIQSITIQYPDHPINSFILKHEGKNVTIDVDSVLTKSNKLNERRANLYLKFFSNINCEGYVNGADGLDSILKLMPKICAIDLTTKQGHKHVDIYRMPVNRRSKNRLTSDRFTPNEYDPDRYYAVINNNSDTVMIQNFVFEKIFRNAYEFYQPDGQVVPEDNKHALTGPSTPMPAVRPH